MKNYDAPTGNITLSFAPVFMSLYIDPTTRVFTMYFRRKMPLEAYLLSVIDCLGCDEYMNKINYIKLGRARNNFRTPQDRTPPRKADINRTTIDH